MSWRRFMVLVRGLGPQSATAAHMSARRYFGEPAAYEVTSPQEAENRLASIVGRKPALVH